MIFVTKNSKPKDAIQFHRLPNNLEEYFHRAKFKNDLKTHTHTHPTENGTRFISLVQFTIFVTKNSKPKDAIQFHNLPNNLEAYFHCTKFKNDLKHTHQTVKCVRNKNSVSLLS